MIKQGVIMLYIKQRLDGEYSESSAFFSIVEEWVKQFCLGWEAAEDVKELSKLYGLFGTTIRRMHHAYVNMHRINASISHD